MATTTTRPLRDLFSCLMIMILKENPDPNRPAVGADGGSERRSGHLSFFGETEDIPGGRMQPAFRLGLYGGGSALFPESFGLMPRSQNTIQAVVTESQEKCT